MVRPLSQFLCGCSIELGCKVIVLAHFALNFGRIFLAIANIIMSVPVQLVNMDYGSQCVVAVIGLTGIPFCLSGLMGLLTKQEQYMRVYLYYSMVCWVIDISICSFFFVLHDPCGSMPGASSQSASAHKGSSQICGYVRVMLIATIAGAGMITAYFIFTIWSYCENLRGGGTGTGLPQLTANRQYKNARKPYSASGLFGTGNPFVQPSIPVVYGSLATPGIGGSAPLFNGRNMQTSYPPKQSNA